MVGSSYCHAFETCSKIKALLPFSSNNCVQVKHRPSISSTIGAYRPLRRLQPPKFWTILYHCWLPIPNICIGMPAQQARTVGEIMGSLSPKMKTSHGRKQAASAMVQTLVLGSAFTAKACCNFICFENLWTRSLWQLAGEEPQPPTFAKSPTQCLLLHLREQGLQAQLPA